MDSGMEPDARCPARVTAEDGGEHADPRPNLLSEVGCGLITGSYCRRQHSSILLCAIVLEITVETK